MSHAPDSTVQIAGMIRIARKRAKLSQEEAATAAEIARSTWQRIEDGAEEVGLATVVRAAAVVGLKIVAEVAQ